MCYGRDEKDCTPAKTPKTALDNEEGRLLSYVQDALKTDSAVTNGIEMIVSEMNKDEFQKAVRACLPALSMCWLVSHANDSSL